MDQTLLRRILIGAVAALFVGNAIALAALPSGERKLAGVLPDDAKVTLTRSLGSVRIVVLERGDDLRLLVAYRDRRRWHSVRVDPAPAGSSAAWAATEGAGPVPAFSAVYGRATGETVIVRWKDGRATTVAPVDGVYLAVRRGHVRPEGVDLTPAPTPATTTTVPAP